MEYYLLRLSYSSTGWKDIIDKAPSFDDRLEPVSRLIASLGGSFASFHFYDMPLFRDDSKRHVVMAKFSTFDSHDLMAVLAMPDRQAASAFTAALSAQPGIRHVELVAMMPFEETITASVKAAKSAMGTARYAGPGPASP